MKEILSILIFCSGILFCACSQNPATDSSDLVFSTWNIAGSTD